MQLSSLGWGEPFTTDFASFQHTDLIPARVVLVNRHRCTLLCPLGELDGVCTGRLLHTSLDSDLPAVGDWVAVCPRPGETCADIHAVLPRRTKFTRRAPEDGREQVIATNIDTVLLVTALDQNYNLRRIERYLAAARESGAQPVVVLNKADLHTDPAAAQDEVGAIAPGVPVVVLSAACDTDPAQALAPWLAPGRTAALLGSSGVGKSTLINRLLGAARQPTAATSAAHGKGRHTTTHRELVVAPSGALVIDTPGLRELQLRDLAPDALADTFADIAALAAQCRFHDCAHRSEPGCAIQTALEDGALDSGRWQSFQKLRREQAYAARKADPHLARANRAVWKKIYQGSHQRMREKYGD